MELNWALNAKDIEVLTVILGGTFLFCVGHYVCSDIVMERFFAKRTPLEQRANGYFLAVLLRGLVLGLGSLFVAQRVGLSLDFMSLAPGPLFKNVALGIGIFVLLLPVLWGSAQKKEIQAHYPELRLVPRDRAIVLNSAAGWFVFMLGYEILFRGLLLHYGILEWGLWPGIAVMTGLYVLAHLHKPGSETFACLVVGPAFAYLTLETGTICAVVVLHTLIGITNENLAAKFNPDFQNPETP